MFRLICILLGYGVGCVQTAYIVGRFSNIDIREHGSGNAGTTNVTRVLGAKAGFIVFVCDILKTALVFMICTFIFDGSCAFFSGDITRGLLPGLYGGLGVIAGHNYPFILKFRGGKGAAASIGVMLCLDWRIAVICYVCGFITVLSTQFVSAASLVITGMMPVLLIVFRFTPEEIILGFIVAGMAYFQHRSNIGRLVRGKENKFSIKKRDKREV